MKTRILISSIVWEPRIYPRSKWNTSTIERYADAMKSGDQFPAMVLEEETNRLLDGKHRLEAYKLVGITEAPVEWKTVPEDIPIKLFAASLSARHGDRLNNEDTKTVVRECWNLMNEEKAPGKVVAKLLGRSEGTVSSYVSDLVAKHREDRRAKALRLSMLGWTQEEIGERLECSQHTISDDLSRNFDTELFASGHTPEEIALRLGLPIQAVLAIQFEKLSDQERLSKLNIKLQPFDVWYFQGCHDLMGDTYPGRIPGGLACHILYFMTNPGDLVIDPMVGSGTMLDACLLMGRKARGYDINDLQKRVDIEKHNLSTGWPETVRKADLVFWDPPYFNKKDADYIEGSISALNPDDYLGWLSNSFKRLFDMVNKETVFTFLMSDWDPENAKEYSEHAGIFQWDYVRVLQAAGWTVKKQIQIPLSTQQVHPDIVNKFRESKRLSRLGRYLLVCKK